MTTTAGRLRIPRSSLLVRLLAVEREILAIELAHARQNRSRGRGQKVSEKPAKLTKIREERAQLLRAIHERDAYILDAFARSLPARLRADLYVQTTKTA
jgi:hypothetical protein